MICAICLLLMMAACLPLESRSDLVNVLVLRSNCYIIVCFNTQ